MLLGRSMMHTSTPVVSERAPHARLLDQDTRWACAAGADPNAATAAGKATPLHRAAYMGHTEVVRLL